MIQLLYLKLNRFVSNKNAIRDAFLSLKQTQDLAKITYSNLRNESKICDNLKSNAIKKNAKDISRYTREAAKKKDNSKLDKIKDRKTKKKFE